MANATKNASTARTANKGRKGPRPIRTVAELRENLMRDMLAKEIRKIDRKISAQNRIRAAAQARISDANATLSQLEKIRAEFLAESGLAPKKA